MKTFSSQLENWLKQPGAKTIRSLNEVFGEKNFAIIFLLLMFLPALPLPTGGITHIFEIITAFLSLELIIGRTTIWLPSRWQDKELSSLTTQKAIPSIVRRVRWFEKISRRRLAGLLSQKYFMQLVGLVVLLFTLSAFVAPPFSGLDTLPSLGVVIISLGLILEDVLIYLLGLVAGIIGVSLNLALVFGLLRFLN